MAQPLRLLVVEDNEDDFDLLLREVRKGGYDVTVERVDTAPDLTLALASKTWDLVISDFQLPTLDALGALRIVVGSGLDLPFLVVSGTIGEDIAVEALRAGAHDFMSKDRLARLLPAIERELREAKRRAGQRAAEDERKRVEAQLLVADRMVAVGTLAAGVAHEINNPLAALIANLELAITDAGKLTALPGADEAGALLKEELADAKVAAERVRNIVRDLKIFSRGDQDKRGPVDVQRVIESTLRMARNEIRHRAKCMTIYEKIPMVDASESRLGQVFLNLIVNAAQAMPEGQADRNTITVSTRLDGGKVVVEIADTGPGLPPEVLKRVFSPFVTTKPVGVGTGLGLSICHRLVTELGGEISVTSSASGATFRVVLPPSQGAAEELPAAAPTVAAGRRGRILVVDDEPMIGKAVERTLSQHQVVFENRAEAALARFENGERFDVILCDLMMPEVSGMDFHDSLSKIAPDQVQAIIFLTGGAFTQRARDFLDEVKNARLDKPFDGSRLRSVIAERLR